MAEPGVPLVESGRSEIENVFLRQNIWKKTERIGIIKQKKLCYDKT